MCDDNNYYVSYPSEFEVTLQSTQLIEHYIPAAKTTQGSLCTILNNNIILEV